MSRNVFFNKATTFFNYHFTHSWIFFGNFRKKSRWQTLQSFLQILKISLPFLGMNSTLKYTKISIYLGVFFLKKCRYVTKILPVVYIIKSPQLIYILSKDKQSPNDNWQIWVEKIQISYIYIHEYIKATMIWFVIQCFQLTFFSRK